MNNAWKDQIPVSDMLDRVVDVSLTQLHIEQKRKQRKRLFIVAATFAIVLGVSTALIFSNPALAGKLPFIGHLFEQVEDDIHNAGNYSENAVSLIDESDAEKIDEGEVVDTPYVQESNGITITVSEAYYNEYGLYFAVSIYNEKGFPKGFLEKIADYSSSRIELESKARINEDIVWLYNLGPSSIDGKYVDEHTFVGILQMNPEIFLDEATYEPVELADEFHLKLDLSAIWCFWEETEKVLNTQIKDRGKFTTEDGYYPGEWKFEFDIVLDRSKTVEYEVNEIGLDGIGIRKIIKTPYEIDVEKIVPEGKEPGDYYVVICDANGDPLDGKIGMGHNLYNPYGRDISKIYVFICDGYAYTDELKGYYWKDGYETRKLEKTYVEYLKEHSFVSAEVVIDK